jgi:hypothetical protein
MKNWRIGVLFLLFGVGGAVFAQEQAVEAKDEPHHRPRFVNDVVRVLDVEVLPGEATQYHTHSLDYPYVMLSTTLLKNDIPGKPQTDLNITAGLVGYYRASQGAYTHRFTNADSKPFRAIGIELLTSSPLGIGAAPLAESAVVKKVLDNERVRGYRLTLAPGEIIGPLTLPGRSVRVAQSTGVIAQSMNGGEAIRLAMDLAQFEWREAAADYTLKNVGETTIELVEFEFK